MIINIMDENLNQSRYDTYNHACLAFLGMWGITKQKVEIDLYLSLEIYQMTHLNMREECDFAGATTKESNNRFSIILNSKFIKKNSTIEGEYDFQIMNCLAHEIIHVKQYLNKELKITRNGHSSWMNTTNEGICYEDLPQEVEAQAYSEEMVVHYLKEKFDMYIFSESKDTK